jgi:DNA modification methylase
VAIALQEDGWWVRSEIIWGKPNPMPESVTDRPATAHEKMWLLSKSARYFYDADAVRLPSKDVSIARLDRANNGYHAPGQSAHTGVVGPRKSDKQRGHGRRHAGFNDRWDAMSKSGHLANGRNLRNFEPPPFDVWNIATKPFSEAHFATFPPNLVLPCILAGCQEGGVVLDPFGGAGTVGLVADRLKRDAVLIEMNPEYCDLAHRRIAGDAPMLVDVRVEVAA